jgi:hypothetical protein
MNLDEMIEALRTIREHVPGDTPVWVDKRDWNEWDGFVESPELVESVGFVPTPPEGEAQRVTIR